MTQFLNTPVDKSLGVTGAWTDIDLSSDVPVNATGAIFRVYNASGNQKRFGLRNNGSGDNNYELTDVALQQFAIIGLDTTRKCEGKIEDLLVDFHLIGYTEEDATFFTDAIELKIDNIATWTDIDLSGEIAAGSVAAIFEIVNGVGLVREYGLRKNGSTDDRHPGMHELGHSFLIVGVDATRKCEGYIETTEVIVSLLGYLTKGQAETNAHDRSLGSTESYIDIDESANAPEGATGVFGEIVTQGLKSAMRKNGTAFDYYEEMLEHGSIMAGLDAGRKWEGKIESVTTDYYSMGYFLPGMTVETKESSIGISVQKTPTKESTIGLSVQETKTKTSSIGMTLVVRKTKTSSIGLSIQKTPTKESSVGISVQKTPTKESTIGLSVQETKTKTSSIGMTLVVRKTKTSSIGLSIQKTPTKESSVGLSVQETPTKESSIGLTIIKLQRKMYPWVRNFKGISEDGRIEIFPGIFEDGGRGERTQNIKTSSVGLSVQETKTKTSSIGMTLVVRKTKTSSIGLSIQKTPTKTSSVGMYVQGDNVKTSSVGLSVQETKTKTSSIGMTLVVRKTKTSSIGLSIQKTPTKASSVGITIARRIELEKGTGTFIFDGISEDGRIEISQKLLEDGNFRKAPHPKTKESSIGLSILETPTKESSVGISVQKTPTKESTIGLSVQETKTKTSSIGMTLIVRKTKTSSIGLSIQKTPTKESTIGMTLVVRKTKTSSIGLSIQKTPTKESTIGMTLVVRKTKTSSIGLSIQKTPTKTSSVGMYVQGDNAKTSSIGVTTIEPILKKGFFYAKLGDTVLYGNIEDSFRILKEINRTPSFEFEIANCEENRLAINTGGGINMDFKIYWQHHGVDTLWFTGVINADGIEYVSLDSIRITGFASYVKLSWPLFKHLASEDKESVNTALTYNGSYFDKTTPINNATINDVAISFGGANHAFYIGENQPFWGAQIKYSTKGIPVEGTVVAIEYSTAAGWETLDVLDETEAFTEAPGTYNLIIPHPPGDWVRKVVNGIKKCWMRYRIVSGSYSIEPKLDQAFIANVDIYRTYYFDTPADEILADVLAGTEYEEDLVDTCPTDVISIVAEYESPLRLIAAIPNALTWTDTEDDNKKKEYQWWIDDAKKVHMKQRRGETFDEDITGEMTIFNNHEDYFHLANRLIGLGPRDGLSQMRAIVQNIDSKETYGLREIAVSEEQIGKYRMLKNSLEKKIAISKDPMQRIRGSVSTQFWGRKEFDVGDTVTLHQEKWHVPEKAFQIVKVDIGPSITTLDLGISQDHLEGLRDDVQRQLNLNNVRMHGSTTLLEAGPERHNYQRVSTATVYPAKLEIDIPSTAKKIHKVFLSWTLGPYRASVGPNTGEVPAHDHNGYVGNGGGLDGFNAGAGGAFTPEVDVDGGFTPQMIGGMHQHGVTGYVPFELEADLGFLPTSKTVSAESSHTHLKGRTGGPDDVTDAVVGLTTGCSCSEACGGGHCITGTVDDGFAQDTHWHLNTGLSTGVGSSHDHILTTATPNERYYIWDVDLGYVEWTSDDEGIVPHAHDGVAVNDHGHTGVAEPVHGDHAIPTVPKHGDHPITSEVGGSLALDYDIYEEAGGTDMELLVNGESVGIYTTSPQTEIRIDGWLNSGSNTVALQPKVGENGKKGGATLSASGLLFVEPKKF